MSEIRLLFVSLPGMLSGILRVAASREPDLRIVEELGGLEGVSEAIDRTRPNVLIVGTEGGGLPGECALAMYDLPHTGILAVSLDGAVATAYRLRPQAVSIEDVSTRRIVEAIRDLSRPPPELRD